MEELKHKNRRQAYTKELENLLKRNPEGLSDVETKWKRVKFCINKSAEKCVRRM